MRVEVRWNEGKNKKWVEEEDENGGEKSLLTEGIIHGRARGKQRPQNAKAGIRSPNRGAAPDSQTGDLEPTRSRSRQERGGRKLRSIFSLKLLERRKKDNKVFQIIIHTIIWPRTVHRLMNSAGFEPSRCENIYINFSYTLFGSKMIVLSLFLHQITILPFPLTITVFSSFFHGITVLSLIIIILN